MTKEGLGMTTGSLRMTTGSLRMIPMFGLTLRTRIIANTAAIAALAAVPLSAQNVAQQGWNPQQILRTETFVKPPADVEHMIVTPRTDITFTTPSPDRKWFLKAIAADRGDIDAYGKSHINLGG